MKYVEADYPLDYSQQNYLEKHPTIKPRLCRCGNGCFIGFPEGEPLPPFFQGLPEFNDSNVIEATYHEYAPKIDLKGKRWLT